MFDVLYAEIVKLRRSKIWLLILLGGFVPALLMLLVFTDKQFHLFYGRYVYGWSYFLDVTLYYANIVGPSFFAVFTGYIFTREYQHHTINTIFTYPFSRFRVFASKLIIIIPVMAVIFLLSMAFTLLAGLFLGRDALTIDVLLTFLRINMEMVIFNFGLIPLAVLVAVIGKSIVAPITLGIIHLLSYAVLTKNELNIYTPGCIPSLIATDFTEKLGSGHPVMYHFGTVNTPVDQAIVTLGILFAVSFFASIIYYRFSEVK